MINLLETVFGGIVKYVKQPYRRMPTTFSKKCKTPYLSESDCIIDGKKTAYHPSCCDIENIDCRNNYGTRIIYRYADLDDMCKEAYAAGKPHFFVKQTMTRTPTTVTNTFTYAKEEDVEYEYKCRKQITLSKHDIDDIISVLRAASAALPAGEADRLIGMIKKKSV